MSETLRERIIALMQESDYAPLNKQGIAAELKLSKKDQAKLDYDIRLLLSEGGIIRIKGDRFCIPSDVDLVNGTIKFRQKGSAIVIPDGVVGGEKLQAIDINAEDTSVAMHDDKVVVRLYDRPPSDSVWGRRSGPNDKSPAPVGRVIRIRERARDTVVGTLCKTKLFYYVAPDDPRIIHDIYVPDPAKSGVHPPPQIGSKVVAKLHDWEQRHVNPEGEIILNLGRTFEPQAELMGILHKYHLDPEFPAAVVAEAKAVSPTVQPKQLKGRRDLRQLFTFTIDPDDAKDFDDALSIEQLDGGRTRIGIHIADVASYVRTGSQLDIEAQNRGNSTYLVGIVVPMLPHALSNGICSLVEDEDRLVKSVFLTFDRSSSIVETDYSNSVIRSNKRLTYKQAYTLLKEDNFDAARNLPLPPSHQTGSTGRPLSSLTDSELRDLQSGIRTLWDFASRMREARMRKGSLNLDMEETKILVDKDGYADRLEKVVNDESHQLIEEFMLAANEAVAREMKRNKLPSIYRVHEDPDEEKLNELRQHMATFEINTGDLNNRSEIIKLLEILSSHPQGRLLRTQVLRSLKKACYRPTPDGHYGLCKQDYLHFTSPIRRYADLVVHRVFDYFLVKVRGEPALEGGPARYNAAKAASLAEHLSLTEVNSVEAERESIKIKLLEFFERDLEKRPPTTFDAIVTEVRNHGMFIELTESNAFGMIHISTLRDDLYRVNASGTALIGRRHRRSYGVGQKIQVQVEKVDRFKRQVDFRVVGSGETPPPPRSASMPNKTARKKGPPTERKPPPAGRGKPKPKASRSRRR